MNDENLESKALCKVQQFHECSFYSNRRHAAGKLLVHLIRENNNRNKHLCGICELGSLKGRIIWNSEVKFSFTLTLIYFRYTCRRAFAYQRAILLPLWAHNGSTSNTLKSMGETKSGCNNYKYMCTHILSRIMRSL